MKLKGKIALVAGATRGCGRGIAIELGAMGATVYCTGRSVRGNRSDLNRPETLEETAELVTQAGGQGIAVRVDHTQEAQVKALLERVKTEHDGQLDILVNDVWGGDSLTVWGTPFWELEPAQGWKLLERSVYSHILTSRYAAALMVERNSGLIIEITDGETLKYRGNFFYDLVKTSVIRLAYAMAEEFGARRYNHTGQEDAIGKKNITALVLTPGFLRSEAMLEHFGVSEANWREAILQDPYFAESETPHYIGRAVAALASDPKVHEKAGKALATWHLAREYGFLDVDGRQPHWQEFYQRMQKTEGQNPL